MKKIATIAAVLFLIAAFLWAQHGDYHDQVQGHTPSIVHYERNRLDNPKWYEEVYEELQAKQQ